MRVEKDITGSWDPPSVYQFSKIKKKSILIVIFVGESADEVDEVDADKLKQHAARQCESSVSAEREHDTD